MFGSDISLFVAACMLFFLRPIIMLFNPRLGWLNPADHPRWKVIKTPLNFTPLAAMVIIAFLTHFWVLFWWPVFWVIMLSWGYGLAKLGFPVPGPGLED